MYRRIELNFNKPVVKRVEKVPFLCKWCGEKKYVYQHILDRGRKYCSTECAMHRDFSNTRLIK